MSGPCLPARAGHRNGEQAEAASRDGQSKEESSVSPSARRSRIRDPRSIRIAAAGDLHTTIEAAGQYRPALLRAAAEAAAAID